MDVYDIIPVEAVYLNGYIPGVIAVSLHILPEGCTITASRYSRSDGILKLVPGDINTEVNADAVGE